MQSTEANSVWLSACVYIQLCDDFAMAPMQSKVTDFFTFSIKVFGSSC